MVQSLTTVARRIVTPTILVGINSTYNAVIDSLYRRLQHLPEYDRRLVRVLVMDTDFAALAKLSLPKAYQLAFHFSGAVARLWEAEPAHYDQAAFLYAGTELTSGPGGTSGDSPAGYAAGLSARSEIKQRFIAACMSVTGFGEAQDHNEPPRVSVILPVLVGRGTSGAFPVVLDVLDEISSEHPELHLSVTAFIVLPVIGSDDPVRKRQNAMSLLTTLTAAQITNIDLGGGTRTPRRLWDEAIIVGNGDAEVGFVEGHEQLAAWVEDMVWTRMLDGEPAGALLRSEAPTFTHLDHQDRYGLPTHFSSMGTAEVVWNREQAAQLVASLWQSKNLVQS